VGVRVGVAGGLWALEWAWYRGLMGVRVVVANFFLGVRVGVANFFGVRVGVANIGGL